MAGNVFDEVEPTKKKSIGLRVFGWTAFALLLAFVFLFGYRVWYYATKIRNGEVVDLPQYTRQFTARAGGTVVSPDAVNRADVEKPDHAVLGDESGKAKLTIVEFADFECPYSKDEATVVRTLLAKYGDKVRLIYRNFPLDDIHPAAFQAAVAAECAREQGKFWVYHDKLFLNAPALALKDLFRYGQEAGLDSKQFERCVEDNRYQAKVKADQDDAKALGLAGTPTFFLNGQKIEGAIPADVLEGLIKKFVR